MQNAIHTGSCLCGSVTYAITSEIKLVSHCHCSMCRKAHGAAFATYGSVPVSAHSFTAGAEFASKYRSSESVTRTFCSKCGSTLLWQQHVGEFAGWVSFPLATLDTDFNPARQKHIYVASKAGWFDIHDDFPQFDTE